MSQGSDSAAESYLTKIGLVPTKKGPTFFRHMERKFGNEFRTFQDLVARRRNGEATSPYSAKNNSLDFSLASARPHYFDYYRRLFTSLRNENLPQPTSVIDIGCANGIVASFMAQLLPKAS